MDLKREKHKERVQQGSMGTMETRLQSREVTTCTRMLVELEVSRGMRVGFRKERHRV
jgi:hypothetical protein